MILVDTSVLIDVFSANATWEQWSLDMMAQAKAQDGLAVSDIVYAELSSGFDSITDLDDALEEIAVERVGLPKAALFLAGHAFKRYRRRGGTKTNVLSDFFVGAHAAVTDSILLTRDAKRVQSYFPTVTIISPGRQHA